MSEREPIPHELPPTIELFVSKPYKMIRDGACIESESFVILDRRAAGLAQQSVPKPVFLCGVRSLDTADMSAVKIAVGERLHLFLPIVVPKILCTMPILEECTVLDVTLGVDDMLHDRMNQTRANESPDYRYAHDLAVYETHKVDPLAIDTMALTLFYDGVSADWKSSGRTTNLVELGATPFLHALAQSKIV